SAAFHSFSAAMPRKLGDWPVPPLRKHFGPQMCAVAAVGDGNAEAVHQAVEDDVTLTCVRGLERRERLVGENHLMHLFGPSPPGPCPGPCCGLAGPPLLYRG